MKKNFGTVTMQIFLFSALAVIAIAGWRVDFFQIADGQKILYHAAVSHGAKLVTEYIHSVEKTEVADKYRIADGKIWSWKETVSSSNAGMPSVLPHYMRFFRENGKMVFCGGRIAQDTVNLRVGNEIFGKNCIQLLPFEKVPLYKALPGKRLTLSIRRKPFMFENAAGEMPFTVWH